MLHALISYSCKLGLHALYPPICLHCHHSIRDHYALCPTCWSQLSFIEPPLCDVLGIPFAYDLGEPHSLQALASPPHFEKARSVVRYCSIARSLVHQLKYGDRLEMAALLGRMMWHTGRDLLTCSDVIIPVPLHRRRLWIRRFNQADLLASTLSHLSGLPWYGNVCIRKKNTPSQVHLKRAQREKNLKHAFAIQDIHLSKIHQRHILIIDDVMTTGASANSLSHTLKEAGAASVTVLTFARVLIHDAILS
jgi:ComF family protein